MRGRYLTTTFLMEVDDVEDDVSRTRQDAPHGNYFFFRFFFAFAALAFLVVGCRFWSALGGAALLGRGPTARMSRRASSKLGG
jgi:hypothetical protein